MSLDDERAAIYRIINALDDRLTRQEAAAVDVKEEIIQVIRETIEVSKPKLTDEEHRWVQLAIKAEARKAAFRQAVIEKTFTALVWAAIALLASGAWHVTREWLINHGYKP